MTRLPGGAGHYNGKVVNSRMTRRAAHGECLQQVYLHGTRLFSFTSAPRGVFGVEMFDSRFYLQRFLIISILNLIPQRG